MFAFFVAPRGKKGIDELINSCYNTIKPSEQAGTQTLFLRFPRRFLDTAPVRAAMKNGTNPMKG